MTNAMDKPGKSRGEVVMELGVSPARRVIGVGAIVVLGGLMAWFGYRLEIALPLRAALALAGIGALWFAVRVWEGSRVRLILTRERLSDSAGRVLAELGEIEKVERGALAVKPSNGFLVMTRERRPAGWAPGLWWRVGRRIGVGGLTGGRQARIMSEVLEALVATRG